MVMPFSGMVGSFVGFVASTVASIVLRTVFWSGLGMVTGGLGQIALGIFVMVGFGVASIWIFPYSLIGVGGGLILLCLPGALATTVGVVAAAASLVTLLVE